jgi:hypothetical protein
METVYYTTVDNEVVYSMLERMTSQTFKLLPMREEEQDWEKPLETLSIELLGLSKIFPQNPSLFSAVCKMEGIKEMGDRMDFMTYRRMIFEICGLLGKAKENFSS